MKKILFFALFLGGIFFSLNVQAQLAACPPGFTSNGSSMNVTISGSSTGLPFSVTAVANTPYNGFGVSCALASTGNNSNGSVTATIVGGSSPFTYNLTGTSTASNTGVAGTTNTFSTLLGTNTGSPVGSPYSVNVVDANNCTAALSGPVRVTAPANLVAGTCMTADLCQTNSAQVQVSAAGGVAGYGVTWTAVANAPFVGTPGGTPASQTIASSGGAALFTGMTGNSTYHFVVTDTNNCIVQ